MKSSLKFYLPAWVLVTLFFNVFCFVLPSFLVTFNREHASFWPGYICVMIALVAHLIYAIFALSEKNYEKKLLNMPVTVISFIELLVMLVAGVRCVLDPRIPFWMGVIVCMGILVLSILLLLCAKIVGDNNEYANQRLNQSTQNVRVLISKSEAIVKACDDLETREYLIKIYEAIRYSNLKTTPATAQLEQAIGYHLDQLYNMVIRRENKDLIGQKSYEVVKLIMERNLRSAPH